MGIIYIYIISFFIQSNVIVCGNSNVFHVDPNCEGLSNCKSKLSYVSITSLTKSNRLCGYENEKVLGKFKDEKPKSTITEFVGVRSKCYSILTDDNEVSKRLKGITKCVVKIRYNIKIINNVCWRVKK